MAGESGYSFSLTTFSPSGKLLQIEHALKAVQAGKTSLGIQGARARARTPAATRTAAQRASQRHRPPRVASRARAARLRVARCATSAAHTRPLPAAPTPPTSPRAARRRAAVNGVVLATEKKVPSILVEEDSIEKIAVYTGNIGEQWRQ